MGGPQYRVLFSAALAVCWTLVLLWHLWRQEKSATRSFSEWTRITPPKTAAASPRRPELRPDDRDDNLFWFVQVSDLHINHFGRGDGLENFAHLLQKTLPAVNPLFVVATGDLTDGKDARGFGSRQQEGEWKTYQGMLKESGVYDRPDFWFEIRGNHDCFGVPAWNTPQNMFAQYSRMKSSTYHHIFRLPFGNYALIAIDGCPDYGPSRPFNFFGTLTPPKMDQLAEGLNAANAANARHTFLISHYPIVTMQFQTTTTGSGGSGRVRTFADLSTALTAYLSGHLHRLVAGMGREIYARQSTGFLDLELNDLKASRIFRIMAVDNDVVSFVDVPIDQSPIILVTNPKDARFHVPAHEDPATASRSSHIRVLLFSPNPISECHAVIGGQKFTLARKEGSRSPLWTAPWSPSRHSRGVHNIRVFARDSEGNTSTTEHSFSLDGTTVPVGSFGEGLALFRLDVWVRRVFWSVFLFTLVALVLAPKGVIVFKRSRSSLRPWSYEMIESLRAERTRLDQGGFLFFLANAPQWAIRSTMFRLCKLYQCRTVFWLVLLHVLYFPIGPLFIAHLGNEDSSLSFFFLWGIWRPHSGWTILLDTWLFPTITFCLQVLPSILVLSVFNTSHDLYDTTIRLAAPSGGAQSQPERTILPLACRPYHRRLWFRTAVLVWWLICANQSLMLALQYGPLMVLLGVGIPWHFLMVSVLLGRALRAESRPFETLNKDQ